MPPKARRLKEPDPDPDSWQLKYYLSEVPLRRKKRKRHRTIGRTPEDTFIRIIEERD